LIALPARTHWHKPLAFRIAPKSGPMRVMETLLDANRAITSDLARGSLKQCHWREVATLLLLAAETGGEQEIEWATERLLGAVVEQGWMDRAKQK
jgi:hypothetical protein